MTWLFLVNFIVLQWFFVRWTRYSYYNEKCKYNEYGYELRIGVLPLTGFWNKHIELLVIPITKHIRK
jgi:hypothetical protein